MWATKQKRNMAAKGISRHEAMGGWGAQGLLEAEHTHYTVNDIIGEF